MEPQPARGLHRKVWSPFAYVFPTTGYATSEHFPGKTAIFGVSPEAQHTNTKHYV